MKFRTFLFSKPGLFLIAAAIVLIAAIAFFFWWWSRPPKPYQSVATVAGAGLKITNGTLPDYFGVAVDKDDRIYFSNGTAGSIICRNDDGSLRIVTSELDMPSAIAFAPDGLLVVADTGAHTIIRVDVKSGRAAVIAGAPGLSGDADGAGSDARFNGPIGVAVGKDGRIFVADTYNDLIREIGPGNRVRTIAGSTPGFRDGIGSQAQFDTPCGLTVDSDGSLLVADTGNHRIRRITADGRATTIAGTGEAANRDGPVFEAAFDEPMAIAVRRDGQILIADAASSSLRVLDRNLKSNPQMPTISTLAGGFPFGLADAELTKSKLHRPTALAFNSHDVLIFADNGNGLIRALLPQEFKLGRTATSEEAILTAQEIRQTVPPRWPFDPPQTKRDIAGTFGEIRGEMLPDHDAWFHNGLDIAGAYGETARTIFGERVTRPLAVEDAGTDRERLRLPLLGYIHVRIGRNQNDQPISGLSNGAITFRRDEAGQVTGVRVRRGTRFNVGDPIGTLNRLNHVHLIAGPAGSEINALAALQFPGLVDTVAPVIESITITNERNEILFDSAKAAKKNRLLEFTGRIRIIVRVFDQADGNPKYRRLGAYRLGYELLRADGSAAASPQQNILFERLPLDPRAVALAYAEGSQSGYEGATIFGYVVTNLVRDGQAREGFLDLSSIPPGAYILRVFADDFFGNRARREIPIKILAADKR